MTTVPETMLSIGEVSALTGLSTHTLRFYEQEGLFIEPVRRNSAGRRVFTDQEVGWLKVCAKLRSSGMSLPNIRRYAELARQGPDTTNERFDLLRAHESTVQQQISDLEDALAVIRGKIALYADHLAAGSADELWRNGPDCTPVE
ncbi:MerR family transcriptional regulator [Nocardia jiangxiensis]|uniref:MerR family transcriptional regulator n=1 Tax=Nocardia jiangxiensis TaxID=282685 RepID=A0ABW6SDE8_9NOCA|nr:MerR family transcriptional regulator [Nocardia jiangxiensis]